MGCTTSANTNTSGAKRKYSSPSAAVTSNPSLAHGSNLRCELSAGKVDSVRIASVAGSIEGTGATAAADGTNSINSDTQRSESLCSEHEFFPGDSTFLTGSEFVVPSVRQDPFRERSSKPVRPDQFEIDSEYEMWCNIDSPLPVPDDLKKRVWAEEMPLLERACEHNPHPFVTIVELKRSSLPYMCDSEENELTCSESTNCSTTAESECSINTNVAICVSDIVV